MSSEDAAKPGDAAKPDPVDAVKEAAKREAVALELQAQSILDSGGRNVGPLMEKAALLWKEAGEPDHARCAGKLAAQYATGDAPKKKLA